MRIGERIKQRRKEKKLTLKQLSEKVDISVSFLSDIENGRSNPSLERLIEIAQGLECQVSYLLGETLLERGESYTFDHKKGELNEKLAKLFLTEGFEEILHEFECLEKWTEEDIEDLVRFLRSKRAFNL